MRLHEQSQISKQTSIVGLKVACVNYIIPIWSANLIEWFTELDVCRRITSRPKARTHLLSDRMVHQYHRSRTITRLTGKFIATQIEALQIRQTRYALWDGTWWVAQVSGDCDLVWLKIQVSWGSSAYRHLWDGCRSSRCSSRSPGCKCCLEWDLATSIRRHKYNSTLPKSYMQQSQTYHSNYCETNPTPLGTKDLEIRPAIHLRSITKYSRTNILLRLWSLTNRIIHSLLSWCSAGSLDCRGWQEWGLKMTMRTNSIA